MRFTILLLIIFSNYTHVEAQETTSFPAMDGLEVTADLYITNAESAPLIVLFHQAGWSRGEYREIAPKLNQMGFNCIAVDQRSGKEVNGVANQTFMAAESNGINTTFIAAINDIEAGINFAKNVYSAKSIIIWGSSYSSSLVLKYAGDNPNSVDGVLAFSPGEYFKEKPVDFVQTSAAKIEIPVFITSSKAERSSWEDIFEAIPTDNKTSYIPRSAGHHGSRALWEANKGNEGYWKAATKFLDQFK
ncbi:MAG: alpha/beta hydrolase [Cyclobacteriaceae bacterium]